MPSEHNPVVYYNGATYVVQKYRSFSCLDVVIWQGFGLLAGNPRKYRRYYGLRLLPDRSARRM